MYIAWKRVHTIETVGRAEQPVGYRWEEEKGEWEEVINPVKIEPPAVIEVVEGGPELGCPKLSESIGKTDSDGFSDGYRRIQAERQL